MNYIDEILVLSHIASGYVRKAYNRSSRVVRSGVDVERFKKSSGTEFKKRYGLENDFVLLQDGNIRTQQAATDSILALKMLSEKYSAVKLVLDGGGKQTELLNLSKQLEVQNKMLFIRSTNDEQPRRDVRRV